MATKDFRDVEGKCPKCSKEELFAYQHSPAPDAAPFVWYVECDNDECDFEDGGFATLEDAQKVGD